MSFSNWTNEGGKMANFEVLKKMLSEIGYTLKAVTEPLPNGVYHGYVVTSMTGAMCFPDLTSVFNHFFPNG